MKRARVRVARAMATVMTVVGDKKAMATAARWRASNGNGDEEGDGDGDGDKGG